MRTATFACAILLAALLATGGCIKKNPEKKELRQTAHELKTTDELTRPK